MESSHEINHSSRKRKLAAILFADIVGYTALMESNETLARQHLEKFRNTLNEQVVQHSGQVINYYGDGCLCVFDSAVDAMNCAKKVQTIFQTQPKVPVRIGLHSGDVFFEANNVYGDSVNIASRIESLGIAGAVLFSKRIKKHIANQKEFEIKSLGEFEFKNVKEPLEVFALTNPGFVIPQKKDFNNNSQVSSSVKKRTPLWITIIIGAIASISLLVFGNWVFEKKLSGGNHSDIGVSEKSIAVLPFKNRSAVKDNQFFCDGVMEAVNNHLSKIDGLKVIARTSMEQFRNTDLNIKEIANQLNVSTILDGSVQRADNKVRISVQLILADNETQIWSDIFDREITDIFQIQSEIAENIARQLSIELSPEQKAVLDKTITSNLTAYDFYLRGRENLTKFYYDRKKVHEENALVNFKQAIELDNKMVVAYADIASIYLLQFRSFTSDENPILDSVKIYSEKTLAIDPNTSQAHYTLGWYYLLKKKPEQFVQSQLKAIDLNENFASAYNALGDYYTRPGVGEYEKGFDYLLKAVELDPFSTWTTGYYMDLASAYMHINDFEKAEYYGKKVRASGDFSFWSALVHLYLMQGKYDKAEALSKEWLAKSPAALRYLTEIEMNHHKNYKKAIELYKEYEKHYPNEANFRQRFGLAYWLDGQKEKGRALLLEAQREFDTIYSIWDAEFCYDKAGILATLGKTEEALAILIKENCALSVGLEHYFLIDPLFKNLWDNEEFQQIVKERKQEKAAVRDRLNVTNFKD